MPTYDYRCDACGHLWDIEQRMTEDPIKKCPECGKLKAKRQITGGNFILKGGGWYADGYGSSSATKKSEPEAAASSSSDTSSSSSTDAKPDAKPSTKPEPKAEAKKEKPAKSESKKA